MKSAEPEEDEQLVWICSTGEKMYPLLYSTQEFN